MRRGCHHTASRRAEGSTRPPHCARWGELIKLATRPADWVGVPAPLQLMQFDAVSRGRTPANTPKVFAPGDSRRPKNVVENVDNPVISTTPIPDRWRSLECSEVSPAVVLWWRCPSSGHPRSSGVAPVQVLLQVDAVHATPDRWCDPVPVPFPDGRYGEGCHRVSTNADLQPPVHDSHGVIRAHP